MPNTQTRQRSPVANCPYCLTRLGSKKGGVQPHVVPPCHLHTSKTDSVTRTSCLRPQKRILAHLAIGSLSETKRETIFEKTQCFGGKHPRLVHRLALVQRCPAHRQYLRTTQNGHTFSMTFTILSERPTMHLGESFPSPVSIE